jgi:hypothetical protein
MDLNFPAVVECPVAAETPKSNMMIVEESLQFEDDPKSEPVAELVNYETNAKETVPKIRQESPQNLKSDDECSGFSRKKRKGKKKRKGLVVEEARPETPNASYDTIPEDAFEVAEAAPVELPKDAPGDPPPSSDIDTTPVAEDAPSPPDPYPELAPEAAPPTEQEPESVDPWKFWAPALKKSKKKDKGQEILSFAPPGEALDPCSPSEIRRDWSAEWPSFSDNPFFPKQAEYATEGGPVGQAGHAVKKQSPLPMEFVTEEVEGVCNDAGLSEQVN